MGKGNRGSFKQTLVPFSCFFTLGSTGGFATQKIGPQAISSRLTALCDYWGYYRITRFRFRIHKQSSTQFAAGAIAPIDDVGNANPGSIGDVGEMISSAMVSAVETVPSEWRRVDCSGAATKWFKTNTTAVSTTLDILAFQFMLYQATGGATDTIIWEMRGTCAFKDPAVGTLNPGVHKSVKAAPADDSSDDDDGEFTTLRVPTSSLTRAATGKG